MIQDTSHLKPFHVVHLVHTRYTHGPRTRTRLFNFALKILAWPQTLPLFFTMTLPRSRTLAISLAFSEPAGWKSMGYPNLYWAWTTRDLPAGLDLSAASSSTTNSRVPELLNACTSTRNIESCGGSCLLLLWPRVTLLFARANQGECRRAARDSLHADYLE